MSAVTGRDPVCAEICEALGLKNCRSLKIEMNYNSVMTIEAVVYAQRDEIKQLLPILKKFKLVPIDEKS